MNKAILLLGLLGFTSAFEVGKEFKYDYKGIIFTGIPEIREIGQTIVFKSQITMQIVDHGKAVVKMSDISMEEHFGAKEDVMNTKTKTKLSNEKKMSLETPFVINLLNKETEIMMVPKNEELWVTNIKKAVANTFNIEPVRVNLQLIKEGKKPKLFSGTPKAYETMEFSLFGKCFSEYTQLPVTSKIETERFYTQFKNMKKDIQKKEITKNGEFFTLTRSINFDKCDEVVQLMQAGAGDFSKAYKGLAGNRGVRYSVTTYSMVEMKDNFRVQYGVAEGGAAYNPYGMTSEKLMTFTNRTFTLTQVDTIKTPIVMTKEQETLQSPYQTFYSPFAPPQNPVAFIKYLSKPTAKYDPLLIENVMTGIFLKPKEVQKYMDIVVKQISEAATRLMSTRGKPETDINLWNTEISKITYQLNEARQTIQALDVKSLENVFNQFYEDQSDVGQLKMILFIEVSAATGSGAPIKNLLNQIESKKITSTRIGSIFVTLSNHLVSHAIIPDLIKYSMTLNFKEAPFLTTTVFVNVASILRKFCFNANISDYSSPSVLYGNEQCDPVNTYNTFVPFLQKLLRESEETWEQMVIVQTLVNLGTEKTFPIFKEIVESKKFDINVIRSAVKGMNNIKTSEIVRSDVFTTLMPIFYDVTADIYLRQIALTTMISWNPSPAWWYRLTMHTWKEPTQVVGDFIHQIFKEKTFITNDDFNQQARLARFLLPLTKSYPSMVKQTSTFKFNSKYNQISDQKTTFVTEMLKDNTNSAPGMSSMMMENSFGGLSVLLAQISATENWPSSVGETIFESVKRLIPDFKKMRQNEDLEQNLNSFMNMESQFLTGRNTKSGSVDFKFFDSIELLVPLTADVFAKSFLKDGISFVNEMLKGKKIFATKFLNAAPISMFLPNEIGMGFAFESSMDVLFSINGESKLTVPGKTNSTIVDILAFNDIAINFDTKFNFAMRSSTRARSLSPLDETAIISGVDTIKSFYFPGKTTFALSKIGSQMNNFTVKYTPEKSNNVPSIVIQNVPFVMKRMMWPGVSYENLGKDFSIVTFREDKQGVNQNKYSLDNKYFGIIGFTSFEGDSVYPYTTGRITEYMSDVQKFLQLIEAPTTRMFSNFFVFDFKKSDTTSITQGVTFVNPFKKMEDSKYSFKMGYSVNFSGKTQRVYEVEMMYDFDITTGEGNMSFIYGRDPIPTVDIKPSIFCFYMKSKGSNVPRSKTVMTSASTLSYVGGLNGGKNCDKKFVDIKGDLTFNDQTNYPDTIYEAFKDDSHAEVAFRIEYKEPVPDVVKTNAYFFYDFMRTKTSPFASFDYDVKNPSGKMTFVGERVKGQTTWAVECKLPTETVEVEKVNVNSMFLNYFLF